MSEQKSPVGSRKRSVRYRLLTIALLPTLVILPLFLGALAYRWNDKFDDMLISKVSSDLKIADQYMAQMLLGVRNGLPALSDTTNFQSALAKAGQTPKELNTLLAAQARARDLDFIYVVDAEGKVISSATPLGSESIRTDWPIVATALNGSAQVGIDVFSKNELSAISPSLADRAAIQLVAGSDSGSWRPSEETRAMVAHAASPLTLADGSSGALVTGVLLNGNLGFIDTINNLIYKQEGLPEDSEGTASLFLDDIRISTNVKMFEGTRALGTRASAAVSRAVLGQGRTWLDDAYVVNDWYISGYEPIRDSYGKRVGMLYVGFIARPFTEAKKTTLVATLLAFLLVSALTVPLFLYWARNIFKSLERIGKTIEQVEGGNLAARTGQVDASDELGQLAAHLDQLLGKLEVSDAHLRTWNEELNARVEERTRNLLLANQQLEETTKQLIMSEKLATIGEITAGVAHEINNPLAVMQGNLEVVRDLMGSQAETADVEFKLLDEQIHRIGTIVTKLLQFSKPSEYAGHLDQQDPSEVVQDTLPLVQHLLKKTSIVVEKQFSATRLVAVSKGEVQQVLVNLIVNAIHAMPEGGAPDLEHARCC